ncbi:Crp/Fnr family transcriptional regulator [Variovorax robiniae]|uniref:Crp/Fnr family transcriptional regulator n=1 Tax=Variovorax robiniae TaxID=1836199 RepID=A0ABU8X7H8_9BURK
MDPPFRSSLALRSLPLFAGLPDARLERLAQQCRWQHLTAHQPLLLRGDPPSGDVYLLLSGRLRVTSYSAGGRQVSFRDSVKGDWFGDMAAIDGEPRSADVVTLEASTVASLDGAAFMALLREEPLVAEREMRHLVGLVRQLSQRVIELSTLGVQNRLHAELLRMARAEGVVDNVARLDPAPLHEALASRISTQREQVSRELAQLTRDGLVEKDGKAMVLRDVERLSRMVAQVSGAG